MDIKIEKGIPLLRQHARPGGLTDTVRRLQAGDSFLLPPTWDRTSCWQIARKFGMRIAIRKVPEGIRVWCIEAAPKNAGSPA